MSYPEPRYLGDKGEINAVFRSADTEPDVVSASGATHYLAGHASTGGEFGLYKVDMGPKAPGARTHFHRTISESFYVLSGEVRLYDANAGSPADRATSCTCPSAACTRSRTTPTNRFPC
jgi:hypothetical protein